MGFWSKLVILSLAALAFFYVKTNFFDVPQTRVEKKLVKEQIVEPVKPTSKPVSVEKTTKNTPSQEKKAYATIYFLGMDKNHAGVFKKVQRELPQGKSKLLFALNQLVLGPTSYEKQLGVYSEIPKNVKILGLVESKDRIVINVSSNIQHGGGADSLYSRMKQLIRTVLANSPNKPVYLFINGKQAEVLGGEGIMISQPLSENSLDG